MSDTKAAQRSNTTRYCTNCYLTLSKSEEKCPNPECGDAEIREFDFELGGFIIPSAGLCREHPFSTVSSDNLPLGFLGIMEEGFK